MIRLLIPIFFPLLLVGQAEVYVSAAINDHILPYSVSLFSAAADGPGISSNLGLNLGIDLFFPDGEGKTPFMLSVSKGTVFSTDLRLPYSMLKTGDITSPAHRVFAQVSLENFNYWQLGASVQPLRLSKKRHNRLALGAGMTYVSGTDFHYALAEQVEGETRLRPATSGYSIEAGKLEQLNGPVRLEMNDNLLRPVQFYGEIGLVSYTSEQSQGYALFQVYVHSLVDQQLPTGFIEGNFSFTFKTGLRGRIF